MAGNDTRSGSDDAKKAAKERMAAALAAKERGEEIVVDQSSLEASSEGRTSSGENKDDGKPVGRTLTNVKVYSPFHVYYDGDANSISAENLTGPFDVLYGHKNFMSLLIPSELVVRSSRGEEQIKIDRGIMHVRDNKVSVFLDV